MTVQTMDMQPPGLTMPPDAAELVTRVYERAQAILEYGAGGSTVLAANMAGKHVTTVESDRAWVRRMRRWFQSNPPGDGTTVDVVWANIGDTTDWGHPVNDDSWRRFSNYPLRIWQRDGFRHPDAVLVDGRFRIGCALATVFSITRPVTLLFDDYTRHASYRQVEEYLGQPRMTGRMAEFRVKPAAIPADRLLQIVKFMSRA
ncbi:hypothetical protein I5535_04690 [Rhodobacteraceae bacterium F11138]|nr:hypothetical protein [Rhodobacteraceae bacterium F11138]